MYSSPEGLPCTLAQFLAAGSGFAFIEYYTMTLKKTKGDICDKKKRERDTRDSKRKTSWASKVLGSGPSVVSWIASSLISNWAS